MTQLGVHALVWSGTWDEAGARHAISSAAAAGFDLIEVPILDPFGIDTSMTRRLLDEHGLASACSMGLPPHADVASEDINVQAEGKKLLTRAGCSTPGWRSIRRRSATGPAHTSSTRCSTFPRRLPRPAYRSTSRW
jgi:hypothetical protein